MRTEIRLKDHTVLPDKKVLEVLWEGRLICTLAGMEDTVGIRIISKYLHTCVDRTPPDSGVGVMEILFLDKRV